MRVSSNASTPQPSARSVARGPAPTRQTWGGGTRQLCADPRLGTNARAASRRSQPRRGSSAGAREGSHGRSAGRRRWPQACGRQRGGPSGRVASGQAPRGAGRASSRPAAEPIWRSQRRRRRAAAACWRMPASSAACRQASPTRPWPPPRAPEGACCELQPAELGDFPTAIGFGSKAEALDRRGRHGTAPSARAAAASRSPEPRSCSAAEHVADDRMCVAAGRPACELLDERRELGLRLLGTSQQEMGVVGGWSTRTATHHTGY